MASRIPPIAVPAALVLFYLAHMFRVNNGLISMGQLALLSAILALLVVVLHYIFRHLLHDDTKAAMLSSGLLFTILFFGDLQDLMSRTPWLSRFSGYRFFLPALLILWVTYWRVLHRCASPSSRSKVFLALLFGILAFSEMVQAWAYTGPHGTEVKLARERNGRLDRNPAIYYILLDEYMGNDGLKDLYGYDNSRFVHQMDSLGFQWAPHPRSQYEFTVYSMASILSERPITDPQRQEIQDNTDYQLALRTIRTNTVCRYLENRGYELTNLSIFDLPDAPAMIDHPLIPKGISLMLYNTLWGRLTKDLPHLLEKAGWLDPEDDDSGSVARNSMAMHLTLEEAKRISTKPRFVYLHLNMPHGPMAMDSLGQQFPPMESGKKPLPGERDKHYLQYLVYTNHVIISFLDSLKKITEGNAVIMMASDHGYRTDCFLGHSETRYSAMLALYAPSSVHVAWPTTIFNNIDQFGILFHGLFDEPFLATRLQPWPPCR